MLIGTSCEPGPVLRSSDDNDRDYWCGFSVSYRSKRSHIWIEGPKLPAPPNHTMLGT